LPISLPPDVLLADTSSRTIAIRVIGLGRMRHYLRVGDPAGMIGGLVRYFRAASSVLGRPDLQCGTL